MSREIDPRHDDGDQRDRHRGGRGAMSRPQAGLSRDPREVFTEGLRLPRGRERERVVSGRETYRLRGSEVRSLATIGAFRVVPASDLREGRGLSAAARVGDLRRLRECGLVRTLPHVSGHDRTTLVALSEQGRDVLEANRDPDARVRQAFYAGAVKPRELSHDSRAYRAYLRTAEGLVARGDRIRRVVLDYELKGQYQRFLQARNRAARSAGTGHREDLERSVAEWARQHHLPCENEHVQFPDVRIEYERPDGRLDVEDVEVVTPHYRGAFAAAKARSGFACYRSSGLHRIGGRSGRAGGRPLDPRVAEEWLQ